MTFSGPLGHGHKDNACEGPCLFGKLGVETSQRVGRGFLNSASGGAFIVASEDVYHALAQFLLHMPIIYSEHLVGNGQEMFEIAAKLNFEGIVSKNAQAPYRSDRNERWLKIKTVQKGKFPVIGFVKDPTGVAALYLCEREGNDLVYMGKVGTGWNRTTSRKIRDTLDTVVSPKSKLTKQVKKPKATWVDPVYMADVEFRDITSEGLLRQSSFKGLSRK